MTARRAFLIAFVALLALLPQLPVPEFWITQLNYIGLYAIVALGLVLLTGVAGLTSFGQAAFVGIGAYTTALLTVNQLASPWITVFVGIALTCAAALLIGWMTLRMSGHYLLGPGPQLPDGQHGFPRQVRRHPRRAGARIFQHRAQ